MYVNSNLFQLNDDTIAAIATPVGSGGIGIIRISGCRSCRIAHHLFQKSSSGHHFHSHRLYHGHIVDPVSGQIVDEVLVTLMKAPHSYTREDILEIQSHGGPVVLAKILDLVISQGARLADPGEFTRRAFLNGRIDLSQAEAVADIINARSDKALSIATDHLSGKMKSTVEFLISEITSQIVVMEAGIEFPEEVEEEFENSQVIEFLRYRIKTTVDVLLQQYEDGHLLRDGLRLSIIGRPNVGKSSLLNSLVEKEKAIVTSIPGTTRDLVEDYLNIRGIPVIISDTAGLHTTDDPVEKIGIFKTRENIKQADLLLFIIDGVEMITEQDQNELKKIGDKNTILVINKIDLVEEPHNIRLPKSVESFRQIQISALTGENLENLKNMIAQHCINCNTWQPGHSLIPNLRQKNLLEKARSFLHQAIYGLEKSITLELIVSDLEAALFSLKCITGENIDGDILDEIFNQFCIGK